LKCIKVFNIDIYTLLYSMLTVDGRRMWDYDIESCNLISKLGTDTEIWHQRNQQIDGLKEPRDYVYLRYKFYCQDCFLVVDQDIDHASAEKKKNHVRGSIKRSIMMLRPHNQKPDCVMLIWLLKMDNNVWSQRREVNTKVTLRTLRSVDALCSYFTSYNFLQENQMISSTFGLFKEGYSIERNFVYLPGYLESERSHQPKVFVSEQGSSRNRSSVPPGGDPSASDDNSARAIRDRVKQRVKFEDDHIPKTRSPEKTRKDRERERDDGESGETNSYLVEKKKKAHHEIIFGADYDRKESGGIALVNTAILKKQRGVLSHFLSKMGSNILKGKSIMSISMPVNIFEPRSLLQKLACNFVYAPIFLKKASECDDAVESFKWIITYALSTMHTNVEQKKPFNPILGETFQCRCEDMKIYMEQTSHHPPISNFQAFDKKRNYKLEGNIEIEAHMKANSVDASQKGNHIVYLPKKNQTVSLTFPNVHIDGIIMGTRVFNWTGKLVAEDEDNGLRCELVFNPDGKGFLGGLLSKAPTPADHFRGSIYRTEGESTEIKEENILSKVSGIWTQYLEIDGTNYWEIWTHLPCDLVPSESHLPSDARLREDLQEFARGDENSAQTAKERLENIQRNDRKLRAKHAKS